MYFRIFVVLLLALSLSACAASKKRVKPSEDISALQAKVSALENALRDKDAAISSLEEELERAKREKAEEAQSKKASKESEDIK